MKLMIAVFVIVTLIILDQTRYHGHYLDQIARAVAWVIG
jgi:hypothetical protein